MKKYLKMICNLLLYVGTYFVIIKSLVAFGKGYILNKPYIGPWLNDNSLIVTVTSDLIQFTIFYFIFKKFKGKSLLEHVKLTQSISIKNIITISIIGIASGFFTSSVIKLPFVTERYSDLVGIMRYMFVDGGSFVIFLLFLIVGSVFKEILFRGLIFNEFKESLPAALAIVLQGLMYGLMFFGTNLPLLSYGFFGAVLFVLLYLWVKSLWASIIAQATCQGCMYILMLTEDSILNAGSAVPTLIISSIIVLAASVYLMRSCKAEKSVSENAIAA
ncbi:CAAX protease [Clostridium sp. Bc-iso-3]|nr:CAAX protease [Clostridium sp. Bc-iso-3]